MSTYQRPIFHLPSFVLPDDGTSPTEYCQALTFLPDRTSPECNFFDVWRGTPWYPNRTSPRRAVIRDLLYGSTPDFDTHFTDKCAVIRTGHPKPGSLALIKPKIFAEAFNNSGEVSIKIANAELTKPKVSKFVQLFPPGTGCRKPQFTNGVDKSIWTSPSKRVTFDLGAESATQSTAEQRAKCRARAHQMTMEESVALMCGKVNKQIARYERLRHRVDRATQERAKCRFRAYQEIMKEISNQISELDLLRQRLVRNFEHEAQR